MHNRGACSVANNVDDAQMFILIGDWHGYEHIYRGIIRVRTIIAVIRIDMEVWLKSAVRGVFKEI